MSLGEEDQLAVETGLAYSCVWWISLAGAFLRSGTVNCEGLENCLGTGVILLKFEENCTWAEQRGMMSRNWQGVGRVHMVTEAAYGSDSLS